MEFLFMPYFVYEQYYLDFPNRHSKDLFSYETELLLHLTIGFYTMAIPLLHFF